jgi:hypothetical protein
MFSKILLCKTNGTQVYETFPLRLRNYSYEFTFFWWNSRKWTSNQIYNYTTSEALMLNIDPSLIVNEAPLKYPSNRDYWTSTNIFTYRLFSGYYPISVIQQPQLPYLEPRMEWCRSWTSGNIEVTTTTNGPGNYKHTIVIKKKQH